MALITATFFNTVVALGQFLDDESIQYTATGFLYGYPTGENDENEQPLYWLFLVTNRHVFEDLSTNNNKIVARFNRPIGAEPQIYNLPTKETDNSDLWVVHPDESYDVALLCARNPEQLRKDELEYSFFEADNHTFALDDMRENGVSEGDSIFVLGFPLGMTGEERNYVVVRHGIVARIQDWLNEKAQTFLVDASIFPGNSGGPVLLKPEIASIKGTTATGRCMLIGMVSSYLSYRETAVSQQTGRPRMIFEENSGLGIVVPCDIIKETAEIALDKLNLRKS